MIKNKYLKEILQTMCSFVGADYDKIDFTKQNWFWEYEWDIPKENTFVDWLTKYLTENKEARKELMLFPSKDKKEIEKWATDFVINYGWKLKI
jgi:hypothetical protein